MKQTKPLEGWNQSPQREMRHLTGQTSKLYNWMTWLSKWWIYLFYSEKMLYTLMLTILSVSNDISMHFQGHDEERHSSVPSFKLSISWFVYIVLSSFHTDNHSTLSNLRFTAETSNEFPTDERTVPIPGFTFSLVQIIPSKISSSHQHFQYPQKIISIHSFNSPSLDSIVFFVEQSSKEESPPRQKIPGVWFPHNYPEQKPWECFLSGEMLFCTIPVRLAGR